MLRTDRWSPLRLQAGRIQWQGRCRANVPRQMPTQDRAKAPTRRSLQESAVNNRQSPIKPEPSIGSSTAPIPLFPCLCHPAFLLQHLCSSFCIHNHSPVPIPLSSCLLIRSPGMRPTAIRPSCLTFKLNNSLRLLADHPCHPCHLSTGGKQEVVDYLRFASVVVHNLNLG